MVSCKFTRQEGGWGREDLVFRADSKRGSFFVKSFYSTLAEGRIGTFPIGVGWNA